MALPGISNANEFYSAHYLESVLTNDIKQVRERWKEEADAKQQADPAADVATPEALFKDLRKPWQKLREAELGITADPAERLRLQRELFFQPLMQALGYPYAPKADPVLIGGEAYQIPLLGEVNNAKGEPWLWVVECFNPSDEPADPLELTIATNWACQIIDPSLGTVLEGETWEELISERIFAQDIPPRWVLAVSRDQLLLIDRQKWAASRLLRFELDTLLGENNPDAVLAAATLLHREHTCPTGGGTPLLDELDENSHKHAYEVSGDLKYALRKSIELLGNEAIYWRKEQREGVFKGKTDADQLTLECLRYMYRLLFLFYIESRPDLGYAPMGSDVYRLGYSLESLRDMDTAELGSEEDKVSTYISDSLDRLFQMIWEGYPKRDDETAQLPLADADDPFHDSFRLTPLKAHLFDPERMPTLTRVRFRNVVLREVIELMSLTKEGKGKRRGRVSYSQLGINQLGAVYEALLSFRGFFAEEDLYEVQPAPKKGKAATKDDDNDFGDDDGGDGGNTKASGQAHDELEVGHFVTAEQLKAYKAEEIVPDPGTGKAKCYPKGSFIYRLAGRDREKSASYYTPESLTQCLVKYALKELLPGKSAADILQLKVCEPAMGSAAFLNEVVSQLAQKYLELRQQETGKSIPHEQFATELQKVKMRLADQNVFGVDLNPVAVELAEVSLWLNSIFTPEKGRAFVPWFSQQLVCGNSLIGARRQIYRASQLPTSTARSAKPRKLWHEHAPEELTWDAELPKDAIFHFLLPDPGMAAYSDKVIKELEPDAIERCKRWNKAFVGEPFTEAQIAHLQRLSKLVDALWKDWAEQQTQLRQRTTDPLPVWEDPTGITEGDWTPLKLKDRIQEQEVLGRDVANTNARLRLKWAMDYWCALWFWPIRQAGSLPSRDTWLLELSMILGDLEQGVAPELGQGSLFADTQPKQLAVDFSDRHGFVDVEKLKAEFERLRQVEAVAQRIRPLHWDLEFADVFADGGFDLIVGNPPWLRVSWNVEACASEFNPLINIRKLSAAQKKSSIQSMSKIDANKAAFLEEGCESVASQNYLATAYRELSGQKFNLYKGFILRVLSLMNGASSIAGLVHPDGIMEDQKASAIRAMLFARLRKRFQFQNGLSLFPIAHRSRFSINVYGGEHSASFISINNLFHPGSIEAILTSSIEEPERSSDRSLKDKQGKWNLKGYKTRIVEIDRGIRDLCYRLFEDDSCHLGGPRVPILHDTQQLYILAKISRCERLRSLENKYISTTMFDQTKSQKEGVLVADGTVFPSTSRDLILCGPHFSNANPFAKTPRRICTEKSHYDHINLNQLPADYMPRSIFRPGDTAQQLTSFAPRTPWSENERSTDYPRVILREMISTGAERSLVGAIIPAGASHIYTCISTAFRNLEDLYRFSIFCMSVPGDFVVKTSGFGHATQSFLDAFPLVSAKRSVLFRSAIARIVALNFLTEAYSEIYRDTLREFGLGDTLGWSAIDSRLTCFNSRFSCGSQWSKSVPLRGGFERRRAMVELDVLSAMLLGLSINDLINCIYYAFPVLLSSEADTFYDVRGQIVFSSSKGLVGIGLPRKGSGRGPNKTTGWEDICDKTSGTVSRTIVDDTLPGGPMERTITYEAPFDRCDRVEDYKTAWAFFEREGIS